MRIDVALSPEEARELRSHAFLGSPYFRFWLRHPMASFVFVAVAFFGGRWAAPHLLGISLVEALVPVGVLLTGGGFLVWLAFARLDPHRGCRACAIALTPAGVERSCEHGNRLTPWSAIDSIVESPQLILFQLDRGGSIAIPKRCLGAGVTPQHLYAAIRRLRSRAA